MQRTVYCYWLGPETSGVFLSVFPTRFGAEYPWHAELSYTCLLILECFPQSCKSHFWTRIQPADTPKTVFYFSRVGSVGGRKVCWRVGPRAAGWCWPEESQVYRWSLGRIGREDGKNADLLFDQRGQHCTVWPLSNTLDIIRGPALVSFVYAHKSVSNWSSLVMMIIDAGHEVC